MVIFLFHSNFSTSVYKWSFLKPKPNHKLNTRMKRLTIHLSVVEKKDNKVFNTVSHLFKSEAEKEQILSTYRDNVAKQQTSNLR